MDEVRQYKATDFAREILQIIDLEDCDYLRTGVIKREIGGMIAYPRQRDHGSHTLYNWLLGWYFYTHSSEIRGEIRNAIELRKWKSSIISSDIFFGHVWQYVSLLHDVGYIFEGSLSAMNPAVYNEQVGLGIEIVADYLNSRFWYGSGIVSSHDRELIQEELKVRNPQLNKMMSLAQTADALRNLGDLSELTNGLFKQLERRNSNILNFKKYESRSLPGDAFQLWQTHFEIFGFKKAKVIIDELDEKFRELYLRGTLSDGQRILDHGVCSGLLLLLIATHYYRILYAAKKNRGTSQHAEVLTSFIDRITRYKYDAQFWWCGIVWGTGASAMHSLIQLGICGNQAGHRLRLTDEPLTFLGILVDCLQEWDRYSVFPIPGADTLQATDVQLVRRSGKIVLKYGNKDRSIKVTKALDKCLAGWRNLVVIEA
ncbi:MAG: hypothetical protein NT002_05440 [candidate division Zixibacteria bacterium]|nr:hypothetical protein [candidate division Zixibacteria bacterium]